MQYYAVTEIELMNFHIASILAGGKEEAKVVLDSIRKRKISYKNIEASNSADGKAGKVSLPEYREYNTTKSKPVLDVCCGTRAFWFDKNDDRALFHDKRNEECPINPDAGHPARNLIVRPDVVGDFTDLKFQSNSFALVVFDPPHAAFGKSSVMAKTYGTLGGTDWRELLRRGFLECFRVLRHEGILVFKWCEWEIPVRDVLALTPEKPLFGHISGKRAQTHWICFMKNEDAPAGQGECPGTACNSASMQVALDI